MEQKRLFSILPKKFKAKRILGEKVPSSGIYECSVCDNYTAFKKGETFTKCNYCIDKKMEEINSWYVTNEIVHFISKNLNIEFEKVQTLHQRLADKITELSGTMWFMYFHVIWFITWILLNQGWFGPEYVFDTYPYGLLTMIVSLEAIFLATFIMISQNLLSKRSELRAELDYQVNLKTEKEVAEITAMLKEMREEASLKRKTEEEIMQPNINKRRNHRKKSPVKENAVPEESVLTDAGIQTIEG